jgi:hypothetical protein
MSGQSRPHRVVEQSVFNIGADMPVIRHQVVLTDSELYVLAKDELMRKEMDQNPPITKLTPDGLEATVVHLHGPNERDVVIVGSGRPFIGANVGPFWVIRDLPSGPQVVLGTVSLALTIQKSSSNGFRDIEAFAVLATHGSVTDYHFDGTKYLLYRQRPVRLGG